MNVVSVRSVDTTSHPEAEPSIPPRFADRVARLPYQATIGLLASTCDPWLGVVKANGVVPRGAPSVRCADTTRRPARVVGGPASHPEAGPSIPPRFADRVARLPYQATIGLLASTCDSWLGVKVDGVVPCGAPSARCADTTRRPARVVGGPASHPEAGPSIPPRFADRMATIGPLAGMCDPWFGGL